MLLGYASAYSSLNLRYRGGVDPIASRLRRGTTCPMDYLSPRRDGGSRFDAVLEYRIGPLQKSPSTAALFHGSANKQYHCIYPQLPRLEGEGVCADQSPCWCALRSSGRFSR